MKKNPFFFAFLTILGIASFYYYPTKLLMLHGVNFLSDTLNIRLRINPLNNWDSLEKTKTTLYEESLITQEPTDNLKKEFLKQTGREAQNLVVYTNKFIFTKNESITFFYASDVLSNSLWLSGFKIFNALNDQEIYHQTFIENEKKSPKQACESFYQGCNFKQNITISASELNPGSFYLKLYDQNKNTSQKTYFFIRETNEVLEKSSVAIMLPNFTWQAYNSAGGGCFYGRNPTQKKIYGLDYPQDHLLAVSLQRPLLYKNNLVEESLVFIRNLEKNHISYTIIDNNDLDKNSSILKKCKTLLIAGHDEYWTLAMRENAENFVKNGGNIANFSGNIAWWQINIHNNTLFVDKNFLFLNKPFHYPKNFLNTGLFKRTSKKVENFFGLSYEFASYPLLRQAIEGKASFEKSLLKKGQNIEIIDPSHPILSNLHIEKGTLWGEKSNLMAVEIDGIPLNHNNDIDPAIRSHYSIPKKIHIIGKSYGMCYSQYTVGFETRSGVQKIGIFAEIVPFNTPQSGKIITVGTIGFAYSLQNHDPITEAVFKNTIDYLTMEK